jgi:hypothetical protein
MGGGMSLFYLRFDFRDEFLFTLVFVWMDN